MEILKTTRGQPQIALDGYLYIKKQVLRNNRVVWRCNKPHLKCPGKITTAENMDNVQQGDRQNHDPNEAVLYILK